MNRYETEKERRLQSVARYKRAWDLRQEGKVYRVIGEALGVSLERARQMVKKYERHLNKPGYLMGIKL